MRHLTIAAIAALVPIAAVSAQSTSAQSMSGQTFVMKAGASDLYEIQSSQLLLTSTKNEKLRRFATMMVQDHTKSTADVKAAAQAAGMTVPAPKLEPMQARNMVMLRTAKGKLRDQLYIRQQRASHRMALQLHQGYAANGTVPQLKAAAAQIAPVVQQHLNEISAM